MQRWYVNGNVRCFNGGHIPLGLLAIVALGFCLSIIPITLIYSAGWLQVCSLNVIGNIRETFIFSNEILYSSVMAGGNYGLNMQITDDLVKLWLFYMQLVSNAT